MDTKMKRRKRNILIAISLICIVCITGIVWFECKINKTYNLVEIKSERNQEIFILGTIHNSHFNKLYRYSMEDIVSCIKNIKPDVVLIESKEETFQDCGVIDGPIDMILTYSYCIENKIPVEMVDWWQLNNDTKTNTTNEQRDDNIYTNIQSKLNNIDDNKRVLIVCGSTHRVEQSKRFVNDGYKKVQIKNRKSYFKSNSESFTYPPIMTDIIKAKIEYLENDFKKKIESSITDEKVKKNLYNNTDALVLTLNKTLEKCIIKNCLYDE